MRLMFDRHHVEEATRPAATVAPPDYHLVRLLRLIFYHNKITLNDFAKHYNDYGKSLNWKSDDIRIRSNNDRKSLTSPTKLTMFLFNRILLNVLRMNIEEFEVVLRDVNTNTRVIYRSRESLD